MKGTITMNRTVWHEMLLQHLGKAVIATDLEGKVTFANETTSELIGVQPDNMLGHKIKDVLKLQDDLDGMEVSLPLEKVIENNELFNAEQGLLMVDGKGRIRQVTYTASPLKDTQGQVMGAVISLCDYTEMYQSPKRLESLLKRAVQRQEANTRVPDYFFVKKDGRYAKVFAADVLYIEAMENYAALVTKDERYILHNTLKNLEVRLAAYNCLRVHRSYIVPIEQIDSIEDNRIKIGGTIIPIGKSYRSRLMKQLHFV